MRLVCPKCSSQYEVDISLFPDEGREVQCSNCEEIWFQHPVEEEKPLRLDDVADKVTETDERPRFARPSERLEDDEQRELAAAVRQEIAAREEPAPDRPSRRRIERAPEPVADDEILSQLREQIQKEGGDFEGDGPTKSSKRNLAKAAEHAGIAVGDQPSPSGRSWDAPSDDAGDDSRQGRKWRRKEKRAKPEPAKRQRRSRGGNLAAALREVEVRNQRSSMGFRHGFLTAVIIAMIGSGIYMFQDDIAQSYPPATPWLAEYDRLVDQGRAQVETLYVRYAPMAQDLLDQATEAVAGAISGGEAPAE